MSSVSTASPTVPGPLLVTVIVYVMSPPASTGSGESEFVTERSAAVSTSVVVVAELLVASVYGGVAAEAEAVFVIVPPLTVGLT